MFVFLLCVSISGLCRNVEWTESETIMQTYNLKLKSITWCNINGVNTRYNRTIEKYAHVGWVESRVELRVENTEFLVSGKVGWKVLHCIIIIINNLFSNSILMDIKVCTTKKKKQYKNGGLCSSTWRNCNHAIIIGSMLLQRVDTIFQWLWHHLHIFKNKIDRKLIKLCWRTK